MFTFAVKQARSLRQPMLMRAFTDLNKAQLEQKLKGGTLLIDVRDPEEVKETGPIAVGKQQGKNVPLNELAKALALSPADFKKKYGFDKPGESQEVIFNCKAGRRSAMASQVAEKLKYTNVFNYTGGAYDWFGLGDKPH